MSAKQIYIPYVFRSFQGFSVLDIKEWRDKQHIEIVLETEPEKKRYCCRCGSELGAYKDQYRVTARHLKIMGWTSAVTFFREKRHCPTCKKVRAEAIEFVCDTSPHVTLELAWWINRLSEITSVLQGSKLESIDKMTCYAVDKSMLVRMLQGYEIPQVTHISVDEVYARGPKQLKEGETRDDLFLTVIVDIKTHKVVWVSKSRRAEALDEFFKIIGESACSKMEVVATDQHEAYSQSVKTHCPKAIIVWDRFHLVQNFNNALNEDRREELQNIDPEGKMEDLMNNKYRYLFLTKAANRGSRDQKHIAFVTNLNKKMARLEIIKEHFHKMFDSQTADEAKLMLADIYLWAQEAKANNIFKWVKNTLSDQRFWNFFSFRFTTGISEGINRAIKGLKWQAYGYVDMWYFGLKIMQKCGYLNHRLYSSSHKF
jgi:transposase